MKTFFIGIVLICLRTEAFFNSDEALSKLTHEFAHIECSSSEQICPGPYCSIVRSDVKNYSISFGCELKRQLPTVFFVMEIFVVDNGEEVLLSERKVNFCEHLGSYGSELEDHEHGSVMELTFTQLVQPCPYAQIRVINGSRLHSNQSLPSGKYKTVTKIVDDHDEKIFEVVYCEEI